VLVDKEFITPTQLAGALLKQSASGKRIGALLVELGLIEERDLTQALAEQLGLELIDLGRIIPDPDALALLPEAVVRGLMAIPIRIHSGQLEIAVADPTDQETAERLRQAAGQNVRLLIAPPTEIRRAIDNSYRALFGIDAQIKAFEATAAGRRSEVATGQSVSEDAPVVKVVREQEGFTLIELLIVIVILGILAAIVVFAVNGITDRGQTNACAADKKTLQTAEEAYLASPTGNGKYADEATLKSAGFIQDESALYDVTADNTATPPTYSIATADATRCAS
jgi:prepilin-type N-terminal cleavage/methylation domain-containing protein